ncbi:hypothetical protein F0U61_15140 [Archangium violaceum]|uniref:hypothetical protein n=1 Tax=Archangium violaceum TaxID=83451 RepID=UPI002B312B6C|nr:hypothetical protein F0U61_15140 [Archangium violaceum]
MRPELMHRAKRTPLLEDPFGYETPDTKVVRSLEWQEAFDQGRRLHEPRSSGFLLQMRRTVLGEIAAARGLNLWAYLWGRRTADRYKPEADMRWTEHEAVFPVRL